MNFSSTISYIARSLVLVMFLLALIVTPLMAAQEGDARATASISGEVYMDGNVNRTREPLEKGIAGARIVLRDDAGTFVAETSTDSDGYYIFDNLATATYQLQIVPPAGFVVTDNGSINLTVGEVGAPLLLSTALRYGVFVPVVTR